MGVLVRGGGVENIPMKVLLLEALTQKLDLQQDDRDRAGRLEVQLLRLNA